MKLTVPNQLTLLRIFLTPVFVMLFLKRTPAHQLWASVVYFIASLTDWYDGWYARKFGVVSRWGQFMDPLADKILVSSALILFAIQDYVFDWMVVIIIVRDFVVTGLRLYALYVGKPIVTHVVAKWKTFAQMITIFGILIFIDFRNYLYPDAPPYQANYLDVIGISMIVVTLLTIVSGSIYLYENWEVALSALRHAGRVFRRNTNGI